MQQFINHDAALWQRGSSRAGVVGSENGSRNSSYFPLATKNENGASNDRKETMQMQIR